HIRNMMHLLFNCAMRWELIDKNPVDLVRQSTRRREIPRVLTPGEFKQLLNALGEPYRTMVLVAGCLGLRISEISGLQWGDIDWDRLTLSVQRSVVSGRVYQTKTEASQKPLPLDPDLAEILFRFRGRAVYVAPSDFIFAGNSGRPRWPGIMLTDHIKPAGQRPELGKSDGTRSGTHSLRFYMTREPTWLCKRSCYGT